MLVALWVALRRPVDARVVRALGQVDGRLAGIDEQIAAARWRADGDASAGHAIGATLDLDEVLQRTLAATQAIAGSDGGRVSVRRRDGRATTAVQGLVSETADLGSIGGPPDGGTYHSGRVSWETGDPNALCSGLVVPLGEGSLSVYSRLANAFDSEAATVLTEIAGWAEPAVRNAFRFLEVQELTATDARTGLGSASAFDEALPREISAARRHGRPLCLLQIDLDDFGQINRMTGSLDTGNAVLAEFGERVRATIRGSDMAFRNSGGADEFFLILPDTTRELAELLCGRLRFEVSTPPLAGYEPTVTMSSGLAELRADDTADSLRRRAGECQSEAKRAGKNRLHTDAEG